ncbi:uncharacterized protein LOC144644867 [Oculina patagonica]
MSENSYDQVLQLSILGCQRSNETCGFRRHQAGYPSLSSVEPSSLFHSPYVAIEYQLGVEQHPNQEIWSCVMSAAKDGFCVNNGEYFIRVHITPQGVFLTSAQGSSTGLVTLFLPSTRPQMFEVTMQLYSTDRGRNVSYILKKISVPGPWLDEYQDGPGIEQPIRKLRPKGIWSSPVGRTVVHYFQRLADDGDHERFTQSKKRLKRWIDNYPEFMDLMSLILYEEAQLDLHENRTEEGKRHAQMALEMSKRYHSPNHCFLLSKLKYVESALARREGNYEKAKDLLNDSVELLLPSAAGEETAENRYFFAAFFAEKSAKVGITYQEEATAENFFQDVERHLNAETRPVTVRCQIRAKNRQLAFYVKSSRHIKHLDFQKVVSEEQMTKAYQLIEEIEENLLVHYPKKPLLSFDIVKTDYFIRRGNFERGIGPSTEALEIAREKRWHEYEAVALQRLQLCMLQVGG